MLENLSVVFVKWGTKYTDDHLVDLFEQIYSRIGDYIDVDILRFIEAKKVQYKFFCDTFDWDKYNLSDKYPSANIQVSIIPQDLHLKGVWNKLAMFRPEFSDGKTLYFDLDTIIQGDIIPFIQSIKWNKLTLVDCHWKSVDIITPTNYDVTWNSSLMAWDGTNPQIHKVWDHFYNSGYKDYFFRKYVKGMDRFLYHEQEVLGKDLFSFFLHKYILSCKYEDHKKLAPIVTFEELDFGSADIISLFKTN